MILSTIYHALFWLTSKRTLPGIFFSKNARKILNLFEKPRLGNDKRLFMILEKIIGLLLIIYGLFIAYNTYKRPDPLNKKSWYAYQFKDYVGAFLAVFIGLVFVLGKLTIAKLFDL